MPFYAGEFKFNKTWHTALLNPFPKSIKWTKNFVVNFRFQRIYNDSSSKIKILILSKIGKNLLFWNFILQPEVLEFFSLPFDTKMQSFLVIWIFRVCENFEKNFENILKIIKNYFKFFLVRNDLEWPPWIFDTRLSLCLVSTYDSLVITYF